MPVTIETDAKANAGTTLQSRSSVTADNTARCSRTYEDSKPGGAAFDAWARHAAAANGFGDGSPESVSNSRRRSDLGCLTDQKVDPQISCRDRAHGEPVLLLHCSSASGVEWDGLCDTLASQFRTIVPDQWSCGKSPPWTGQSTFMLEQEVEPLLEILDSIGEPVHLVGHSYGGGVALRIARENPDRIRSLTLIEPSAFHILRDGTPDAELLFSEVSGIAESVRMAIAGGDYWSGMSKFVDYWNGSGSWQAMPYKSRMKLCQRLTKVALDFHALFEEPARVGDYACLRMPTLILCGERSPRPSKMIVDMLAATLPAARTEKIAGASHMSPFTHADDVNRHITAHLRANASHIPIAA